VAFDPMLERADPVRLRDGRSVLIRPARHCYAELALVRGLCAASRYERSFLEFRELAPKGMLPYRDVQRQASCRCRISQRAVQRTATLFPVEIGHPSID
jgi:hypothetical protein